MKLYATQFDTDWTGHATSERSVRGSLGDTETCSRVRMRCFRPVIATSLVEGSVAEAEIDGLLLVICENSNGLSIIVTLVAASGTPYVPR
jgi:hypothetical protein